MVLRALLLGLVLVACRPAQTASVPPLVLHDTAGGTASFPAVLAESKATAVVFYSHHCPCFRAHEERIKEIARDYSGRGVKLLLVDSEVDATAERDAKATERGLPPVVLDPGAKLADAVGADYATYTVVFDAEGRIRYRGGIDTDKNQPTAGATPYLRDALDDLVAGKAPRRAEGKALGCALQKQ